MKRVVITGLGVVAPNGVGLNNFDKALRDGTSGIKFIQELKELGFKCQVAGVPKIKEEIKSKFLPSYLINRIKADNLLYGLIAALEAWNSAKLKINDNTDWNGGCIMGATANNPKIIHELGDKLFNNNIRAIGSRIVEQSMVSALNSYLTGYLGLGNCSIANSSACSTGTESIVMGYDRIKMGRAKYMLVGSYEGSSPLIWVGFDRIRALNSLFNDNPEKASRPMSADATGFIPGSGAGALVLEELESALNRKATIYAEILGGNINCGGQRNGGTMTKPNVIGMKKCIESALNQNSITPNQIDLISGHLTATYVDPFEIGVWKETLGREGKEFPYINSLKSLTGHCLGAAGSIETVSAVLQLYNGYIHPSINTEEIHPKILAHVDASRIPQKCIKKEINFVAKANFGFGDVNSCLILKKWKNYEN